MGMIDIAPLLLDQQQETTLHEHLAVADTVIHEADPLAQSLVVTELAAYVKRCYQEAKDAKRPIEQQMLANLKQRRGEYDSQKLTAIRQQGLSDLFLKLTDAKCRGAESWIRDVLLPAGDKPWTMDATPLPDLPDELASAAVHFAMQAGMGQADLDQLNEAIQQRLMDDAKERAQRMERYCEDQQVEGGFRNALSEIISDVVTLKAGIMKAPVLRNERQLSWGQGYQPIVNDEIKLSFERVSPFDFYPAPESVNVQQAAYVIERHCLQPTDLMALKGVAGYDAQALDQVLQGLSDNRLGKWLALSDDLDALKRSALERDSIAMNNTVTEIDALQFFGQVNGQWLQEWGLQVDSHQWYEAEVWLVGDQVIKAALNEHPLGLRPYYHTGAVKINDQFWHTSVPELMDDCQDVINASARNLVNNMGMASAPQVAVDLSRISKGFDYHSMHPWKIWTFKKNETGTTEPPIQFFQPNSHANELIGVLEKFKVWADELTGIPAYTSGIGAASGAGKTASGLSMLMNAAAKGIRSIIYNIDIDIVEPVLYAQFVHNMLYSNDQSIKGDITIKPRGAAALIVKEQMQIRRGEFLASTANPVDMDIIGKEGRAELLREVAKSLDMPVDRLVPSREEIQRQKEEQAAMQQAQQQMQMQAQMQQPQAPEQAPETALDGATVAGGHEASLF
jgi:hypothetical protein